MRETRIPQTLHPSLSRRPLRFRIAQCCDGHRHRLPRVPASSATSFVIFCTSTAEIAAGESMKSCPRSAGPPFFQFTPIRISLRYAPPQALIARIIDSFRPDPAADLKTRRRRWSRSAILRHQNRLTQNPQEAALRVKTAAQRFVPLIRRTVSRSGSRSIHAKRS